MKNGFFKGHGLGNEYIVLDPDELTFRLTPGRIARICDRVKGIGSDGVLTLEDSHSAEFGLRIWNPDGSESETSGNGLRIFALYLHATGRTRKKEFTVETPGGTVRVETRHDRQGAEDEAGVVGAVAEAGVVGAVAEAGTVCGAKKPHGRRIAEGDDGTVSGATVHMGKASFDPGALPCTLEADELIEQPIHVAGETQTFTGVSVGNPHCVVFRSRGRRRSGTDPRRHEDPNQERDDLTRRADSVRREDPLSQHTDLPWSRADLLRLGPALETHPIFPQRTNVQLAERTGPNSICILIWERGAGETLSSGSSACAAASAAVRLGLVTSPVTVESPGGALFVDVNEAFDLTLKGPVAEVARGTFNEELFRGVQDSDD